VRSSECAGTRRACALGALDRRSMVVVFFLVHQFGVAGMRVS
jgi:hypothetical protein